MIVPLPDCEIVPVLAPGLEVAIYEVIVEKPSEVGAVNETVAVVPFTTVAEPIVGALGAANVGALTNSPSDSVSLPPIFVRVILQIRYLPPVFFNMSEVIVRFSALPKASVKAPLV